MSTKLKLPPRVIAGSRPGPIAQKIFALQEGAAVLHTPNTCTSARREMGPGHEARDDS
jgi:hypothetical protein